MTQADIFARSAPPTEERRAEFDVDYTPPAVVAQVLLELESVVGTPEHILDVAAGAGVWSMVARELWPDAHIAAVELREEEEPYLHHWCDKVIIGDIREVEWPPRPSFDLIMGNIPFSLPDPGLPDKRPGHEGEHRKSRAESFRAFVVAMRPLLIPHPCSRLSLYVPTSWWLRSTTATALAASNQPSEQWNVPLPIRHRAAGSADLRSYSVYAWARERLRCGWTARDLPALSKDERKWVVVPGTERGEAPGSETR